MDRNSVIEIRVNSNLIWKARKILREEGLTIPQAIILFLERIAARGKLPFQLSKPNAGTRRAMNDIVNRRNVRTFVDVKTLITDLETRDA